MPIYEYICRDCGNSFEKILSSGSETAAGVICPACASANIEKKLSTFATKTAPAGTACSPGGG